MRKMKSNEKGGKLLATRNDEKLIKKIKRGRRRRKCRRALMDG